MLWMVPERVRVTSDVIMCGQHEFIRIQVWKVAATSC